VSDVVGYVEKMASVNNSTSSLVPPPAHTQISLELLINFSYFSISLWTILLILELWSFTEWCFEKKKLLEKEKDVIILKMFLIANTLATLTSVILFRLTVIQVPWAFSETTCDGLVRVAA
jgi:hypothetical protein